MKHVKIKNNDILNVNIIIIRVIIVHIHCIFSLSIHVRILARFWQLKFWKSIFLVNNTIELYTWKSSKIDVNLLWFMRDYIPIQSEPIKT